jgi:hypothetical protein
MLTAQEKRMLDAARAQMDAEQRAAFDELSDDEKKELLGQVETEARRTYGSSTGRLQMVRSMSCGEFVRAYSEHGLLEAFLAWVFLRMIGTKAGCLTLIVIAVVLFFVIRAQLQ